MADFLQNGVEYAKSYKAGNLNFGKKTVILISLIVISLKIPSNRYLFV